MAKEPDPIKKVKLRHSGPLTSAELREEIAAKMGGDLNAASKALDAITEVIRENLAEDRKVIIKGLGSFEVRKRQSRMVRNPLTGEKITKSADSVVKMTIAKALKDAAQGD